MAIEPGLSLNLSKARMLEPLQLEPNPDQPGDWGLDGFQALGQALEAARIGVLDLRLPSGLGHFTPECLAVLGYGEEDAETFASGWVPLVHPQDLPVFTENRRRAVAGESSGFDEEVRRMRRDGRYAWVRTVGKVVELDAQGKAIRMVATLQDVDARHRAEDELRAARQELQALSAHIESHLEAERKLIASEVHDQCGQLLTLLKIELAELRSAAGPGSPAQTRIAGLNTRVDELVALSRNLIARLRPPALDLGLVPALEWLAGEWSRQSGMTCEFSCPGEDLALPDDQATTLFRLVQESLTNAARHARASWVHVGLAVRDGCLDLRVADNGCGFDPAADHAGHFGLLGMRERAQRMGAQLELSSRPGAGTQVRVTMPLPNDG